MYQLKLTSILRLSCDLHRLTLICVVFLLFALPRLSFATSLTFAIDVERAIPNIQVENLTVETAELLLCTKFEKGELYCSFVVIESKNGAFSTLTDAPKSGAYQTIDPMGLFWTRIKFDRSVFQNKTNDIDSQLDLLPLGDSLLILKKTSDKGGAILATKAILENETPLIVKKINNKFATGLFYQQRNKESKALIFVLGGCPENNEYSTTDAFIAANQYLVFQFFYTNKNNNKSTTSCAGNINLMVDALHWFKTLEPDRKIFVVGKSRGAEAAWWLAHFYPQLVSGVIAINGTTIQMPSVLGGTWQHDGATLNTLEIRMTNISAKVNYRLNELLSLVTGENQKYSQRAMIEGQLKQYSEDEIIKNAIPINCTVPSLSLNSVNDELIPESLSVEIQRKACNKEIEVIENANSSHDSFEIGWESNRCSGRASKHPYVNASILCPGNALASKKNVERILYFLAKKVQKTEYPVNPKDAG